MSIPFVVKNSGTVRNISIRSVIRAGMNLAHEPVPLTWEHLQPGQSRGFTVDAGPLTSGGVNNLRLTIIVATRVDEIEEFYAFTGNLPFEVSGAAPTQVVQHFNLAGADFGTAGMVVANPQVAVLERRRARLEGEAPRLVPLERAERYEVEQGYRGYREPGGRIPRHATFVYTGLPDADKPSDGPLLRRPRIRCGRNGRESAGRPQADANDLSLRIYDPVSGALDRDASATISRRAFDLMLCNDRLYIRALTDSAVAVNGQPLARAETRIVSNGDSLRAPARTGRALTLSVTFGTSADLVTQVCFEKAS